MVVSDVGDLGGDQIECPFCAERIQRKALKCKHCGEFLNKGAPVASAETSKPGQPSPPAPEKKPAKPKQRDGAWPVMVLLTLVGVGGLAMQASQHPTREDAWYAAAAAFVVVGPIAWRIGNAVRRFAMPSDVFVAGGFYSIVKQKLFWRLGPQAFAMLWAVIGVGFLASTSGTTERLPGRPTATAVDALPASSVAAPAPEPSEAPPAAQPLTGDAPQAASADGDASPSDAQAAAQPSGSSSTQASTADAAENNSATAKPAAPSDSDYAPDPYQQQGGRRW